VVAIALIVGGLIIFWVEAKNFDHKTTEATKITYKQALLVGCAQCVAMIPGTSRSGATIVGGMFQVYLVKQQQSFLSWRCQRC
jgi:undecaprenyl-diphosphatase